MLKYVALLAITIAAVAGCKPVNPLPDPIPTDAPITIKVPK